jgi:hypothetical protein
MSFIYEFIPNYDSTSYDQENPAHKNEEDPEAKKDVNAIEDSVSVAEVLQNLISHCFASVLEYDTQH